MCCLFSVFSSIIIHHYSYISYIICFQLGMLGHFKLYSSIKVYTNQPAYSDIPGMFRFIHITNCKRSATKDLPLSWPQV